VEYLTVPLEKSFDRKDFDCGKSSLNDYIQTQVSQDVRKKLSVCFVLLNSSKTTVEGYYTLSNASIPYDDVPENLRKKYPKSYDYIPVTLLGRLALDEKIKGQGFGSKVLIDALKRSLKVSEEDLGSVAVIVDPLDEDAENYYSHFGFVKLPNSGKMFLDMNTIKKLNL
jgi:predicted GNAT family N-acyltransferase